MQAHIHLVKYALSKSLTVSVFDGEEWAVKKSSNYGEIIRAVDSVEEAQLRIRDTEGNKVAWALIIQNLGDDETVADYSDNEFMAQWNNNYSGRA